MNSKPELCDMEQGRRRCGRGEVRNSAEEFPGLCTWTLRTGKAALHPLPAPMHLESPPGPGVGAAPWGGFNVILPFLPGF